MEAEPQPGRNEIFGIVGSQPVISQHESDKYEKAAQKYVQTKISLRELLFQFVIVEQKFKGFMNELYWYVDGVYENAQDDGQFSSYLRQQSARIHRYSFPLGVACDP